MSDNYNRAVLVTGASSGLGFEAAAQFADEGFGRVIVAARTGEKADAAVSNLRARTHSDSFEPLVLDLDDHAGVLDAVAELSARGGKIDVLLLNAGIVPAKEIMMTMGGIEATASATLIGHHLLTMQLLEHGALSSEARIIIAGSEAARGDVPMFKPIDVHDLADRAFGGDLEAAIEAVMRTDPEVDYDSGNQYATVKVFAAWWATELAKRLPEGMTANTVSPGSTPETNADRNAPFLMKRVLVPFFKLVPGMSHTVGDGARRYLDVAQLGREHTGKFFASRPKKMTGPLHEITMDHLDNEAAHTALWNVASKVAGGIGYPV